ncbi:AraC family transcriptional regulator [Lysinibacillus sp. NPDC097287]|uniref:helix-turn-helix transcriptional regulator n=1 Tax=Lysinibacillus sp. NPDC097287 TaxID=3364144 RepID=UPI0037F9146F
MRTLWQQYEGKWSADSIWITDSPSIKAKKYLNTLHEFGTFFTTSAYYTERKGLDIYLLLLTLDGKGFLQYEGECHTLQKGSVFFIHCERYQKYWTDPTGTWDFIWVHINGSMVTSYFELLKEYNGLVQNIHQYEYIARQLKELTPLLEKRQFYDEVEISHTIQNILVEMVRLSLFKPSYSEKIPSYVLELQSILKNEYTRKWKLDLLASRLMINKFQMVKQFKKYIGFSPNEYLIVQRIHHAKKLLRNSNDTVSEIARAVGIEDVSHFIDLFKKREGITPLVYRTSWT